LLVRAAQQIGSINYEGAKKLCLEAVELAHKGGSRESVRLASLLRFRLCATHPYGLRSLWRCGERDLLVRAAQQIGSINYEGAKKLCLEAVELAHKGVQELLTVQAPSRQPGKRSPC
jgi:hypothetical protein